MTSPLVLSDVRAAWCTIADRPAFLCDLQKIAASHDTHIICFDADMIAGRVHATAAVAHAVRAFQEGENISNTLEMEALLYVAGSRQCNIAVSFGIHEGRNKVYICCSPVRDDIWKDLEPLVQFVDESWDRIDQEMVRRLMKNFSITPDEIVAAGGEDRIVELVLERTALLQVLR
jgi:KEOPS complex subunit Cgi121